jgi:PhnB protein
MKSVNPYLNFPGTAEAAFTFYKSVFGGEFGLVHRFRGSPMEAAIPESERDRVMHISLPIAPGQVLMASDTCSAPGAPPYVAGTNFSVSFEGESEAEAEKVFNGLSAGGKVSMPMQKTFWGAYFGMVTDQFGIAWMISYHYPQPATK